MMNAFTVLMALASAANAHMVMKTPTPALSPNNSPLDASGSDFPCKIPGGSGTIPDTNKNVMTIGSSNTLSFTGSAVHGGGSCQVSLAKGNTVSKDTKWMVIHSIEGGCPANVAGNLPADPNGSGASTFQFVVPDHPDLGPGTYTLAWTWNNKIGNREMYMNCAYVDLQAAKKKRYMPTPPISKRAQAPLPAMFVANIGNGCTVPEGTDVQYPDPGASVEVVAGSTLGPPTGNCGASGAQPGSGSGSSPSAGASSPGASSTAGNTVQPVKPTGSAPAATSGFAGNPGAGAPSGAPTGTGFAGGPGAHSGARTGTSFAGGAPTPTGGAGSPGSQITQSQGGNFATVTAPAGGQSSAAAAAPSAPAASASQPAGAAPTTGSSPTTGTCEVGEYDCATDGQSWKVCISGGSWSASIQAAAGMSCSPGKSTTLNYGVASTAGTHAKRDMRAHIARRAHGLHGSFVA